MTGAISFALEDIIATDSIPEIVRGRKVHLKKLAFWLVKILFAFSIVFEIIVLPGWKFPANLCGSPPNHSHI